MSTPPPLRVLQVVDSLDAGGMEAQLVALMNRLDPARFDFHVVCLRHAGVNAARLPERIPVTALGKAEGFQTRTIRQLRAILHTRYDLIHTHNWAPLVYSTLASLGGRTAPILHGEHSQLNATELSPKRLLMRRLLYRTCSAVHTVSADQRDELLRVGLRHRHLLALINGVDSDRFKPTDQAETRRRLGLPECAFIIGMVARFGAFKRHSAMLNAFEILAESHPTLHLLLVGDGGPEKERVRVQAEVCRFASRIIFAGHQPDPVPWYQSMDLLAVPSTNEGLSNATLEAMASGVPVLSNVNCGATELLGDNEGGWVHDLRSLEKLTESLATLLRLSADILKKQGLAGRRRVERHFSWDGMASAYEQTFKDYARGQLSPP